MADSPSDDARLRSTEAQMRRALGLSGDTPSQLTTDYPTGTTNGSHSQRRRFVRDGEVPVTILHRHQNPDAESTSQLDAARNAMRSLAAGKEHAERLLEQAQAMIRDLQTKLAHERLAKDAAIERAASERKTVEEALQTVRLKLAAEKIGRERAAQALHDAQATITNLTEKLRGAQQALQSVKAEVATEPRRTAGSTVDPTASNGGEAVETVRRPVGRPRKLPVVQTVEKPAGDGIVKRARRRGRPPKPPDTKPVKWWLQGR